MTGLQLPPDPPKICFLTASRNYVQENNKPRGFCLTYVSTGYIASEASGKDGLTSCPVLPATAEALRDKTWPRSGVSEGVEKIWSSSSNPESGPDLG